MAKSICKCKKGEECEECPEWIFTFADLVMLMMGFFVILWVLKPAPGKKDAAGNEDWVKVAAAIRAAFGYEPNPQSNDPVDVQMLEQIRKLKFKGDGEGGRASDKGEDGTEHAVTNIRPARQATEGGKLLFDHGSSALLPETMRELDQIIEVIRGHRNIVLVKGHTSLDDFPADAAPQQQMDLSLKRAQVVADYLTQHGVAPELVRVEGCSTFEPLIEHDYTADAQRLNRRVEVEATAQLVQDLQGTHAPSATQP